MSKIDIYKKSLGVLNRLKRDVTLALGRDGPNNDKASVDVKFTGIENADWTRMKFTVGMCHGYYGSSSAYSDTSEDMGRYLAKAIQKHRAVLLDTAVSMAADDVEVARKAAEDEAKEVLSATS